MLSSLGIFGHAPYFADNSCAQYRMALPRLGMPNAPGRALEILRERDKDE